MTNYSIDAMALNPVGGPWSQVDYTKLRWIVYARKSSESAERQAMSIAAQTRKIRETFPGLNIVAVKRESKSAFTPGERDKFDWIINALDAGRADGIIAWHPDRLSRNEIDAASVTYRVRTGAIKHLLFCTYNFVNSPDGIRDLQMALSQSQHSSAKLSVDVRRGNEEKLIEGWKPGLAPTGYLNDKAVKTQIPDPERFNLVRRMWDLLLTADYTSSRIAQIASTEWGLTTPRHGKTGGGPITAGIAYQIFTNPFYAGFNRRRSEAERRRREPGQLFKAKHKPMVTPEEYWKAQAILSSHPRSRLRKVIRHDFTYRGLISCGECGAQYTAEVKKGIIYYHCTHKKSGVECGQRRWIREDHVEATIRDALGNYAIEPQIHELAKRFLQEAEKQEAAMGRSVKASRTGRLEELRAQHKRLVEMHIKGLLETSDFVSYQQDIKSEMGKLVGQLDSQANPGGNRNNNQAAIDLLLHGTTVLKHGTHRKKRTIARAFMRTCIARDGQIEITPQDWLIPLANDKIQSSPHDQARTEQQIIRNVRTGDPSEKRTVDTKNGANAPKESIWLARIRELRATLRETDGDYYLPRFNPLGDVIEDNDLA